MLKPATLEKIESRFGRDELFRVIRIEAILHSTKPKVSDFAGKTSFESRVKQKFAKLLGEDEESADRVLVILMAACDMETHESFAGLGGCKIISFEEAIQQQKKDKEKKA